MNDDHMALLTSEGWRDMLRDLILPFGFNDLPMSALGDNVLEVGPGPGMTTDLLRTQLPRLTCIEIDGDLAAQLTARLEGTNVHVVRGDATDLPFADAQFSGVASFTMLHHVPSRIRQERLFAEAHRVLKPGGLLVASDSMASEDLRALHVDDTYCPVDPRGLKSTLEARGFNDVEVTINDFAWACRARRSS